MPDRQTQAAAPALCPPSCLIRRRTTRVPAILSFRPRQRLSRITCGKAGASPGRAVRAVGRARDCLAPRWRWRPTVSWRVAAPWARHAVVLRGLDGPEARWGSARRRFRVLARRGPGHAASGASRSHGGGGRPGASLHDCHCTILVTTPAPTVRPPSRMAKRRPSSIAIGAISDTSMRTLSPGITISVPSGSVTTPVTSVVRK
jgi:hypothetical protein